tara:strand:- start:630 stop:953 length:324 start_codon:yes stop_codon:yes gene_type:complete
MIIDLPLEPMAMCSSWEHLEVKVKGSKGAEYIVTHGKLRRDADYEYGFSCNCPAFKYRKGECKHIKAVKVDTLLNICLWHQQFDGGAAIDGMCPKCGNEIIGIMCAV